MKKFAFLFPGQGTQFVQMGKTFYENYSIAKQTYEEASMVLGNDIAKLCFESSMTELNRFTNMQLAIVVTEISIFRSYMEDYGIDPQFMAGHSIGEYAALVCSGAATLSDIVKILHKRGELVERVISENSSRMTILEHANDELIKSCIKKCNAGDRVFLSCYNSKTQYAISGTNHDLDNVEKSLSEEGVSVSALLFSPPMHSPLMTCVKEEFYNFLTSFRFYPMRCPILSNVTGKPFTDISNLPYILAEHLASPVLFSSMVNCMYQYGITTTIEMSPKLLVSKFVEENTEDIDVYCYGVINDRQSLDKIFSSDPSYEKDMPNFFGRCLSIIAGTQNKVADNRDVKEISKIYNQLKEYYVASTNRNFGNKKEQYSSGLNLLIKALQIKNLDCVEIQNWVKTLVDETNSHYMLSSIYNALID